MDYRVASPFTKLTHESIARIFATAVMTLTRGVTTTRAVTVRRATTSTTTATGRNIGDHVVLCLLLEFNATFSGDQLSIEIAQRDWIRMTTDVLDERVELEVEAGEDVGGRIFIVDLLADSRKIINITNHLGVVGHTRHLTFVSRGELVAKMHNLRARVRRKHVLKLPPNLDRASAVSNL